MRLGWWDVRKSSCFTSSAPVLQDAVQSLEHGAQCIYNIAVRYEWDREKNEANIAAGRIGFEAIRDFDWDSAIVKRSDRYGEIRWAATGYIRDRIHRVVYTRREEVVRIISLRRASKREVREYAAT